MQVSSSYEITLQKSVTVLWLRVQLNVRAKDFTTGAQEYSFVCLLVFKALRPGQQFFSHFGKFSLVLPVLSKGYEVSCSRTQHRAPGEDLTRNLTDALPTELSVLPEFGFGCNSSFYSVTVPFTLR